MTDAIPCGRIMRGMREPQEEAAGNEDYHEQEEQIIRTEYSELMQKSYIDYAMSVIIYVHCRISGMG